MVLCPPKAHLIHFLIPSHVKAYYILDELLIAGELQEPSKKTVARLISAQVCVLFLCIDAFVWQIYHLLSALYCWLLGFIGRDRERAAQYNK